jgi:hypothetical protein
MSWTGIRFDAYDGRERAVQLSGSEHVPNAEFEEL